MAIEGLGDRLVGAGSVACYSRPGRMVMAAARRRLGEAPEGYHRLMVRDAFSSAAAPMHPLTRQALELYMIGLEDDGVLAFQTTNKHLDLAPVLRNAPCLRASTPELPPRAQMATLIPGTCAHLGNVGLSG